MPRKHHFTEEEIKTLSKHPGIKHIRSNRIVFTYDFRCEMYDFWKADPGKPAIRQFMSENGIDIKLISGEVVHTLDKNFKFIGRPSRGKNKEFGVTSLNYRSTPEINEYLLSTGKFIKKSHGISFSLEFIQELYHSYPAVSIEEGLRNNGIDPEMVGYHRIYQLGLLFDGKKSTITEKNEYSNEIIQKYMNHPYVQRMTNKQFVLKDIFYKDAYHLKELSMDEILEVFCIDYHDLGISLKNRIKCNLISRKAKNEKSAIDESHALYLQIQRNRNEAIKRIIDSNFEKVRTELPTYSKLKRKALCKWISSLPEDNEYTITSIINKVGISRSNYYSILKNDDYGISELRKNIEDEKDIAHIQNVIKYKDIPKGSRMIHMMLPRLEGVKMSRNKILRLMRKFDMTCKVRKSMESRINNRKLLEENKKDNLLKRQFRLCRPFEVMLTDVSYLKYGNNNIAYLSCVKDSSSGRILSVAVSGSQTLTLTDETLDGLKNYKLKEDGIFHSDQGTLYLTPSFQNKIEEMKLKQSMSRRGNCWDNASQESFFGHFKDECDYSNCTALDDVVKKVKEYMDYYNDERPQWTRNKMTPAEFEKYLLEMSQDDFNDYLESEKSNYEAMRQKAIEKAKKRVKDLGAV